MKHDNQVEAFYPSTGGIIMTGLIGELDVKITVDFQPLEEVFRKLQQDEWERKGREIAELIRRLEDWLNA